MVDTARQAALRLVQTILLLRCIMARGKRVWWVGLYHVIRLACQYIERNATKLPEDMPQVVKDAFPYIVAACAALEAYDKTHKRGN